MECCNRHNGPFKVALLGAGYIAPFHAEMLRLLNQTELVAICDKNLLRAENIAKQFNVDRVFSSLDHMLEEENLDVVHVLLPPNLHHSTTLKILNKGIHVFLEKPMGVNVAECSDIVRKAEAKNLKVGVNHNFLFYPVYEQLRQSLRDGELGRPNHITVNWLRAFELLDGGTMNEWAFNNPKNIFYEIGSHLAAWVLDLLGEPERLSVETSDPYKTHTEDILDRRWLINGYKGNTCVQVRFSVKKGFEDVSLEVRGLSGKARADINQDTFILDRHTKYNLDLDRFLINVRDSFSIVTHAFRSLTYYLLSLFRLSSYSTPYRTSFYKSISTFYTSLNSNTPLDVRHTPEFGRRVVAFCERVAGEVKSPVLNPVPMKDQRRVREKPEILILGGTGFIGKALTRLLISKGKSIRLLVRSPNKIDRDIPPNQIEVVQGDLTNSNDLEKAIKGTRYVYHLARAHVFAWEDYVREDIEVTQQIADQCIKEEVEQFIYTGTIDSYYSGKKDITITEKGLLDEKIHTRNYYAQAKAASENILRSKELNNGMSVTILRPGIVLGRGASPFHWGVGFWHYGSSVCQLWGSGTNPLPLVLVQDVAEVLELVLGNEEAFGESFSVVDGPCLSALEYVQELQKVLKSKIEVLPTPIFRFYITGLFKALLKRALGRADPRIPSYRDWKSRSQLSLYDCTKIRQLGWKPTGNREKIIELGIRLPAEDYLK